jgi:hypothetical protein
MMFRALPWLLRFLTSFLMLFSIVWQVADRVAHNLFRPGEYFAYFTIQSSMIAAVTLAVAGWFSLTGKDETRLLALVRLSVTCFAAVTGIVYNALLRGMPPVAADVGYKWPVFPNEILHVWAPILIALDFVLFAPKIAIRVRAGLWVWAFPFAWLGFSVIRGLASDWWPYWFINPTGDGGLAGMLTYVFGIMAFLYVLSLVFLGLKKLRNSAIRA